MGITFVSAVTLSECGRCRSLYECVAMHASVAESTASPNGTVLLPWNAAMVSGRWKGSV